MKVRGINLSGILYLTSASALWGGMYVVSKYTLSYIQPFFLMWIRFAIASVILLPILLYINKKEKLKLKDLKPIVGLTLMGNIVSNGCSIIGTYYSNAHIAALLSATSPIFTLPLAWMILKEKLTWNKLLSVLISTLGIIIVIGINGYHVSNNIFGDLLLLSSAISWGVYSIYFKKVQSKYSDLFITIHTTFAAFLFMIPVTLCQNNLSQIQVVNQPHMLLALFYLGVVSTACATFLWNRGMKYVDASYGMVFYFVTPLVGSLLSGIFLHEYLKWNFFAGGCLVLIGLIISMPRREKVMSIRQK